MKAAEIALFVICIQIGIGFVLAAGFIDDNSIYYESEFTNMQLQNNMSALNTMEQDQVSLDIFRKIKDVLTWEWIRMFFPMYQNNPTAASDIAVKNFVDTIQFLLAATNVIIIGAAVIEFFRNQTRVL